MTDKPIINQGKTKEILDNGDYTVDVRNKDAITAGDGLKKDSFEGKGVASTRTTSNVFTFLNNHGVPTAFIEAVDDRTFRAHRAEMIPLECVVRRIGTGSWLERHPDDTEGRVFEEPTFELFYKDDGMHDPLVQVSTVEGYGSVVGVYSAHEPLGARPNYTLAPWLVEQYIQYFDDLERITRQVFLLLEEAFTQITIDGEALVLVDFKIELGVLVDGSLVVADVIDNDSWRVWKGGVKEGQVDKQVFREIVGQMSPEQRQSLKKLFEQVAEATDAFRTM